jgi:hypothetical protein
MRVGFVFENEATGKHEDRHGKAAADHKLYNTEDRERRRLHRTLREESRMHISP